VVATRAIPRVKYDGPFPVVWLEHWDTAIEEYFEVEHGMLNAKQFLDRSMVFVAREDSFHPVREYLDGLKWDGKKRLDEYLIKGFGAEDTPLNRAFGSRFLIACVRRVRKPGTKVDTMLVLEGEQGILKSTGLQETVPFPEWYKDGVGDIRSKDTLMMLSGKLIVEWSELKSLREANRESIKHFISVQVDEYRAPFDRRDAPHPRQCVFAATTNSLIYIDDPTGGRRFWPVLCLLIDIEWIIGNRDQLWAEASAREAAGEKHWLDTPELVAASKSAQSQRANRDEWTDAMVRYCSGREYVIIREFLVGALHFDEKDIRPRPHQERCTDILQSMGWVVRQERMQDGTKPRIWRPSTEEAIALSKGKPIPDDEVASM